LCGKKKNDAEGNLWKVQQVGPTQEGGKKDLSRRWEKYCVPVRAPIRFIGVYRGGHRWGRTEGIDRKKTQLRRGREKDEIHAMVRKKLNFPRKRFLKGMETRSANHN